MASAGSHSGLRRYACLSQFGASTFSFPRAFLDSSGALHLIWLEPDSIRTAQPDVLPSFSRLYHAVYRAGSWRRPEVVYQNIEGIQDPSATPRPLVDREGRIHLALVTKRSGMPPTVIYLHGEEGRWRMKDLGVTNAAYVDVALGNSGKVFLGFVAAAPRVGVDLNSVLFTSSPDGGNTWNPPVLVSRSGRYRAFDPKVISLPDGSLHLLWAKDLTGDVLTEALWLSSSTDGGDTWGEPVEIEAPEGVRDLNAVSDPCGGIHVAFAGDRERPRLYYVHWNAGIWTGPEALSPGYDAVTPRLVIDPEGSLHLVWNRSTDIWDPAIPPTLVYSRKLRLRKQSR